MSTNKAVPTDTGRELSASEAVCVEDPFGSVSGLVQTHDRSFRRTAFRRLSSWQDAEDVCQEAYVKLLDASRLPSVKSLPAYVFRMVKNAAVDLKRKHRAAEEGSADELVRAAGTARSAEEMCESRDVFEQVMKRIDDLPERSREALLLYRFQELSLEEVASRLGIEKKSVHALISRALKYLSEVMPEEHVTHRVRR